MRPRPAPIARPTGVFALALLLGAASPSPKPPAAAGGALVFSRQTVDFRDRVGEYSHLVLDGQGDPHISYYKRNAGELRYAHRTGATWSVQTIDGGGSEDVGAYTHMVLDAQGEPHIAYFDWGNFDLMYIERVAGQWQQPERVDAAGHVGRYPALGIDGQGDIHIVYHDIDRGDVKYARRTAGVWSIAWVDSVGEVGAKLQGRMDSHGWPCASYYDLTNSALKFARLTPSGWQVVTVDEGAGTDVGGYTALALHPDDRPYILYSHWGGISGLDDIWLAHLDAGGTWRLEPVDEDANQTGFNPSIEVDAVGVVHCAYRDHTTSELKYAVQRPGGWDVRVVDSDGDVGYGVSLEVDGGGLPHFSYYNQTPEDLQYLVGNREVPTPATSFGGLRARFRGGSAPAAAPGATAAPSPAAAGSAERGNRR